MRTEPVREERVLTGLGVSPGLALGVAHVSDHGNVSVPEFMVEPERITDEIARFEASVAFSRRQLAKLKEKSTALHGPASVEIGYLLDAHLAMLAQSRLVRGVQERIRERGINAEAAVHMEVKSIGDSFAAMEDAYLAARIEDVRIVGTRLIRNLTKTPFATIGKVDANTVLLSDELTPADTALIDPTKVVGFATVLGGAEGHTAIMAKALGLPAVLGCAELLHRAIDGETVLINGFAGTVTLSPAPDTLERYHVKRHSLVEERRRLEVIGRLPSMTRDGTKIHLQANLELPREVEFALAAGAEGIGLVRTEFLFMNRDSPPSEDEQAEVLSGLVRGMNGHEVTIRTLDIGGDKLAFPLKGVPVESANPALGLRAIRLTLKHRELLETQLAAILRAAASGSVRILIPMISSLSQVRDSRAVAEAVLARLKRQGLPAPDKLPPIGIMIEVPGAALAADTFALESDFFALGTNDLTQYTLAVDRSDEQVADLYNPLHPGVLRLIQFTAEAAARANIPVSVCGEMAGDPRCTALLLGLGVRTLSMAPSSLPRVKQRLRGLTIEEAQTVTRRIMSERDERRIAELLDDAIPEDASSI